MTLLCAVGALFLFITLFIHGDSYNRGDRDVPRPTTEVRSGSGYYAAMTWLAAQHIRVVSLRERFNMLARQTHLAPSGNLLIVTLPAATIFKTEEFRPLDRWVRDGNTLLVLAALDDSPDWALALRGMTASDLNLLTGLEFESVKSREHRMAEAARGVGSPTSGDGAVDISTGVAAVFRKLGAAERVALVPNAPHAYFAGVHEAIALSDYPTQPWTVKVPYDGFVFALAHQKETGEAVLWSRPHGNGKLIVSGCGSVFTNRALGLADNGRLLANIVGAQLGPAGSVLFDDAHQGLLAAYDPAKFYSDRRLYVTVGILALVWLAWVLGGTTLRLPQPVAAAPAEADLVRAAGGFLAGALIPAAAARRMLDHFLRHHSWESLERHSRVAGADVRQLKAWHSASRASRRVSLTRLHNLIVRINRQLNS